MNRLLLLLCGYLLLPGCLVQAQVPVKQWDRTFGGTGDDRAHSVQQTRDGGFIVGGNSASGVSPDKTQVGQGADCWVIKLDSTGAKQWDRTLGGESTDDLYTVLQTADGGYVVGATSFSSLSGDKSQPRRGGADYWVVRLDANGNKLWDRTFGGNNGDFLTQLQPTADGGYVLGGYSYSDAVGEKTQPNRGPGYTYDYWVVKIDAAGTKQWDRTYGGADSDGLRSLCQTGDGGYILGGTSSSDASGEKSTNRRAGNGSVFWLVKLDAQGNKQWDRDFGSTGGDRFSTVRATADGGYILGGDAAGGVVGNKSEPSRGDYDSWLLKLDATGTKQWDRTLGGGNLEWMGLQTLAQTPDGGYLVAAISFSGPSGDRTAARRGSEDYWAVKLDATGTKQWDVACGSSGRNELYGMQPTTGGGLILVGYSDGGVSLDKSQPSRGGNDFWVVKLAPQLPTVVITGDSLLCAAQPVRLTASPPALAYAWSTGATTAGITVSQPGTYSLQAQYPNGRSTTARFRVQQGADVSPFSLGADTTLCEGTTLVLRSPAPAIPGLRYEWSDGSSASTLVVRQAGQYTLRLSGCNSRQASRLITYRACVMLPNIITPNGDAYNEFFHVKGLVGDWSLQLYNRWGTRVFSTDRYLNNWGTGAAPGFYFYLLRQPATGGLYKGWLQVNP